VAERLAALRQGDLARAVALGRQRIQAIPAQGWTLRLEIANLPATLQHAVEVFPGQPDLFIAPIRLRGGRTAYQLFLGDYASQAEAERAARAVPAPFLEGGQRPKVLLAAEIPTQVQAGK
jgi:septal ring-binding cell division protein DamX